MAKTKSNKLTTEQQESKDLAKTEYTKDQQKRLAAYHYRAKRKALKFKIENVDSNAPAVAPISACRKFKCPSSLPRKNKRITIPPSPRDSREAGCVERPGAVALDCRSLF
jgi:uncharacterized protein (DUF3084 family)